MTLKLPSFSNPPVVEVVASAQFEPLADLNVVRLGQLWARFSDRFPNVEQHPRLGPEIERLGIRAPLNSLQFQFGSDATSPRVWFVSSDGTELVQVQGDRFIRNWRFMPAASNSYPRYENHVRPEFVRDFNAFHAFVAGEPAAKLAVNQCEITYINHIYPNAQWKTHSEVGAVFEGWGVATSSPIGLAVEATNSRVAYMLNDDQGNFIGRLHVTIQTAFGSPGGIDGQEVPLFVLTMTARGRPLGDGLDGVVRFLDRGHIAIVSTFEKMTTPRMHEIWGKQK